MPRKRQKKKRYNGNGMNACDKKPPEYINHIWSYDFVEDKLDNGRKVRVLNIIDEYTRECLNSESGFTMKGHDVIDVLRYLFLVRGCPTYIRSDNGPEFIAELVKHFLAHRGVETLNIEPGSPCKNGYIESFNARMRDELLNGELLLNLTELKYVVDRWRMHYNHYPPHSSLGYQTPAAYAEQCRLEGLICPQMSAQEQENMAETLS